MIENRPDAGAHRAALERPGLLVLDGNEKELIRPALETFKKEGPGFARFGDLYTPQEIGADVVAVEAKRKKSKYDTPEQKERELYATILEMVLMEFGNSWLPGSLTRASEFDDFERGTDLVLEFEDDAGTIHRAGLDVVSGRRNTEEKILQITDHLFKGKLNELKYFESDIDETRGRVEMPRLIIGTDDLGAVAQLARLYLSHEASQKSKNQVRVNAVREAIANHPIGEQILAELIFQLKMYPQYLKRAAAKMPRLATDIDAKAARLEDAGRAMETAEQTKRPGERERARAMKTNKVLQVIMSRLEPVAA